MNRDGSVTARNFIGHRIGDDWVDGGIGEVEILKRVAGGDHSSDFFLTQLAGLNKLFNDGGVTSGLSRGIDDALADQTSFGEQLQEIVFVGKHGIGFFG